MWLIIALIIVVTIVAVLLIYLACELDDLGEPEIKHYRVKTNCAGYHHLIDAGVFEYDWESDCYVNDEHSFPAYLVRNETIQLIEV